MSVKHLWSGDIALRELLSTGHTDAPRDVLVKLRSKGYVKLKGRQAELTAHGRRRAQDIGSVGEHSLRQLFGGATAAGGGCKLQTVGSGSIHLDGGSPVTIRG